MEIQKKYVIKDNLYIQELIRVAIQSRSTPTRNVIAKKDILNTLFLAKEHLLDKNPVKHVLAFYWYLDGPYSATIETNLKTLVDDQKVHQSKTDAWETYKLVPEHALRPIVKYDNFLDDAAYKVRRVAKEFVDMDDMVRQIHATAPTLWYTLYRLEFMPKFEAHCKEIQNGLKTHYTAKQMLEFLDDAVLDFPITHEFLEIRMLFMDFAKILNALLRWDAYHTRSDLLNELLDMCRDIWKTFAYVMRIHHHDPYYERHIDNWKHRYTQEISKLDCATLERVKKFDSIVVDDMHLAPDMEDMVLHPERYTFKPLEVDVVADTK